MKRKCMRIYTRTLSHLFTIVNTMSSEAEQIGARLKSERLRLAFSQEAFGKLGGVRRVSQYLYEQGDRTPDAIYLTRVARAGANVNWILFGKSKTEMTHSPGAPSQQSALDVEKLQVLNSATTSIARARRRMGLLGTSTEILSTLIWSTALSPNPERVLEFLNENHQT